MPYTRSDDNFCLRANVLALLVLSELYHFLQETAPSVAFVNAVNLVVTSFQQRHTVHHVLRNQRHRAEYATR